MLDLKRIDVIKKISINIVIIAIIAIIAISAIFTKPISDLDEIWNFNFARNISDGLVPYKDFNMVPTPLFSMLCGTVLLFFGKQLIIMRILAIALMCGVFYMAYKVLNKLLPNSIAMLMLTMFVVLYKDIMCIDYNYAVLLIALVLLYIELCHIGENHFEYSFKYNFLLGLLCGLAILFKQTTGVFISIACIGYKIFEIRDKDDIKRFTKIAITRMAGCIIPICLFVIYLVINGAMYDFISYTILGVRTFSNKIAYKTLFADNVTALFSVIVPSTLFVMLNMIFIKETKEEIYIIFAYAISSFIVTFPISDKIHFLIGSMITIIGTAYIIYEYIIKPYSTNIEKKKRIIVYCLINFFTILFLLLFTFGELYNIYTNYYLIDKEKELNHFINIPKNLALNERIIEVEKYILNQQSIGRKVYILDAEAALYNIPLDIYNKDYDMFNKGNLGKDGEDGIIERIKKEKDTIYLIKKEKLNWQNPNKVREYIQQNLSEIGEISVFMIYE